MQSETLAQEFTRLVKEYHEGDDHTKPEAWNLLADYAVDNADAISAALSEKQTVEVNIKPLEWEGELGTEYAVSILGLYSVWEGHYRLPGAHAGIRADDPKQAAQKHLERIIRSALVDVPAVEPVGDDLIGYVLRYGGMCRDCADMDGVCQSGQPCDTDQRRAVVKHTVAALAYGIKHGFIANPFTSPPLSREGEDSTEVIYQAVREFRLSNMCFEEGDAYCLVDLMTADGRDISDGEKQMRELAFAIAEALAATRSGSATTHSEKEV